MEEVFVTSEVDLDVEETIEKFRQRGASLQRSLDEKKEELKRMKQVIRERDLELVSKQSELEEIKLKLVQAAEQIKEKERELKVTEFKLMLANASSKLKKNAEDGTGDQKALTEGEAGKAESSADSPNKANAGVGSEVELLKKELSLANEKITELKLKIKKLRSRGRDDMMKEQSAKITPPAAGTPKKSRSSNSVSVKLFQNESDSETGGSQSALGKPSKDIFRQVKIERAVKATASTSLGTPLSTNETPKVPTTTAGVRISREIPRSMGWIGSKMKSHKMRMKFPSPKSSTGSSSLGSCRKSLVCRKCKREFSNKKDLKAHNVLASLADRCPSPSPKKPSKKSGSEKDARVTRSKSLGADCFICGKAFETQAQLNMHMKMIHFTPKSPKVKVEKRKVEDMDDEEEEEHGKSVRSSHIGFNERVNSFKCTKCPERFCWKSDLEDHVKDVHG